jgi:hypothetical protein
MPILSGSQEEGRKAREGKKSVITASIILERAGREEKRSPRRKRKEAMSKTLGDMEAHKDLDDMMYSTMFMPLDMLELGSDPFGASGEFTIKFT